MSKTKNQSLDHADTSYSEMSVSSVSLLTQEKSTTSQETR